MEKLRAVFCCSSSAAVDDGPPPSSPERREVTPPPRLPELNLPAPLPRGSEHYFRTLAASNSERQHVAESGSGDNTPQNVSPDELTPLLSRSRTEELVRVPSPTSTGEGSAEGSAATMTRAPRRHSTLPGELPSQRGVQIAEPARGGGSNRAGSARSRGRAYSLGASHKMTTGPKAGTITQAILESPFFTNPEGENIDGLVRMKLDTGAHKGGVSSGTLKLATRVLVVPELAKDGCNMKDKRYSTLTRTDDGTWEATSAESDEKWTPENGMKYIFVTMRDGTIRIGTSAQGTNGHAVLAGHSPYVRYAGEVMFKDKRPVRFSPRSGTYMPPMEMSANAGFGPECECIDLDAWNNVK